MTASAKERSDIQRRITAGLPYEESGLPDRLRDTWDQLAREIAVMHENGIVIDVVTESADWDSNALAEMHEPSTEQEPVDYHDGMMLDDKVDRATPVSKPVDEIPHDEIGRSR